MTGSGSSECGGKCDGHNDEEDVGGCEERGEGEAISEGDFFDVFHVRLIFGFDLSMLTILPFFCCLRRAKYLKTFLAELLPVYRHDLSIGLSALLSSRLMHIPNSK